MGRHLDARHEPAARVPRRAARCSTSSGASRAAFGAGRRGAGKRVTLAAALVLFVAFVVGGRAVAPADARAGRRGGGRRRRGLSQPHEPAPATCGTPLMRNFDVAANRRWHARAGFDAVFMTDHNHVHEPARATDAHPPLRLPRHRNQRLGRPHRPARPHPADPPRRLRPLARRPAHAPPHQRLGVRRAVDRLAARSTSAATGPASSGSPSSGLDGFEIVNAAPKANELSRARRDSVIALARRYGRLLVGVSDSHGWGATSMVWNLVRVPGWRDSPPARLRRHPRPAPRRHRRATGSSSATASAPTPGGRSGSRPSAWSGRRGAGWAGCSPRAGWSGPGPAIFPPPSTLGTLDASHPLSRHRFRRARPRRHE